MSSEFSHSLLPSGAQFYDPSSVINIQTHLSSTPSKISEAFSEPFPYCNLNIGCWKTIAQSFIHIPTSRSSPPPTKPTSIPTSIPWVQELRIRTIELSQDSFLHLGFFSLRLNDTAVCAMLLSVLFVLVVIVCGVWSSRRRSRKRTTHVWGNTSKGHREEGATARQIRQT